MASSKWATPEAIVTLLSTELNALANNGVVLSAAINNETELYTHLNLELYVAAQGSARSAGAYVAVYILPSVDGTNFDDATVAAALDAMQVYMALDAATTARYKVKVNIPSPPLQFKLQVENKTGQAFANTLSTLKYRRHMGQVV
jgi:hypothetical protein